MAGRAPRVLFSDTEIAFLLNYADYCLRHSVDYKATISAELGARANTTRKTQVALKKLSDTLKKYVRKSADAKQYIQTGTGYLTMGRIPTPVLAIMNRQRTEWGFDVLRRAAVPDVQDTIVTGSSIAAPTQRVEVSTMTMEVSRGVTNRNSGEKPRRG